MPPRGRPRAFNPDTALEAAMQVFWTKGYEGASLSDLTEAMGINRPSLYATFGDKQTLFQQALERYRSGPGGGLRAALRDAPSARAAVEAILTGAAAGMSSPDRPQGCVMVHGALACSDDGQIIETALMAARAEDMAAIIDRLTAARADGELPSNTDVTALGNYVSCILYGMAVLARSGSSTDGLLAVVQQAMLSWPDASA